MTIFCTLFATSVAISLWFVFSSALFAWYEQANGRPQLMADRFAPTRLGFALRLLLTESLCLWVTLLLHPWGWLPRRPRKLRRDQVPVLLLHGLFHNRACWLWLRWRLYLAGVRSVHSINLPPWKDVEALTERVAKKVDELRLAAGTAKVHLVGHSMGGIIARNYIQLRGGAAKVDRCLLLAAPNGGSKLAALALSPLAALLLPGSEFLQRLAAAPLPTTTRLTTLYSRHDNIVLPPESARLAGAENLEVAGLGHVTLLYHPQTLRTLVATLTEKAP